MNYRQLALLFFLFSSSCFGQTISIIDFVKIKDNKTKEALFFYENNWKVYREEALKKNYIVSYKLVKTSPDSTSNFNLILITEFADSADHALAEVRFQEIIKRIRPNGPKLLNDLKPTDFRQNVFVKKAETLFTNVNEYELKIKR